MGQALDSGLAEKKPNISCVALAVNIQQAQFSILITHKSRQLPNLNTSAQWSPKMETWMRTWLTEWTLPGRNGGVWREFFVTHECQCAQKAKYIKRRWDQPWYTEQNAGQYKRVTFRNYIQSRWRCLGGPVEWPGWIRFEMSTYEGPSKLHQFTTNWLRADWGGTDMSCGDRRNTSLKQL